MLPPIARDADKAEGHSIQFLVDRQFMDARSSWIPIPFKQVPELT